MSEEIRLVLIESDLREAKRIRTALAGVKSARFSVESVQHLSTGLERLAEGGVDAVLVDLSVSETPGLGAFLELRRKAPELPIIALAESEDETLALAAVHEGAQDYLVKGRVPGEGLARCIRYAIERNHIRPPVAAGPAPQAPKQARVLSFLGAKGGVGTSTVAVNVACALARMGNSLIVAELRSYAGTLAYQLHRLPPPQAKLDETALWNSPFGFRVLFGPQVAQEAELSGRTVEGLVRKLAGMCQFVILDLAPHPSEANRTAIRLSTFVGLVTEREPCSLFSAELSLERMRSWQAPAELGVVVVNRVPLSVPVALPEIAMQLAVPVVGVIPPAADSCVLATKTGTPMVMAQPESLMAGAVVELATKLAATPLYLANCF